MAKNKIINLINNRIFTLYLMALKFHIANISNINFRGETKCGCVIKTIYQPGGYSYTSEQYYDYCMLCL